MKNVAAGRRLQRSATRLRRTVRSAVLASLISFCSDRERTSQAVDRAIFAGLRLRATLSCSLAAPVSLFLFLGSPIRSRRWCAAGRARACMGDLNDHQVMDPSDDGPSDTARDQARPHSLPSIRDRPHPVPRGGLLFTNPLDGTVDPRHRRSLGLSPFVSRPCLSGLIIIPNSCLVTGSCSWPRFFTR